MTQIPPNKYHSSDVSYSDDLVNLPYAEQLQQLQPQSYQTYYHQTTKADNHHTYETEPDQYADYKKLSRYFVASQYNRQQTVM